MMFRYEKSNSFAASSSTRKRSVHGGALKTALTVIAFMMSALFAVFCFTAIAPEQAQATAKYYSNPKSITTKTYKQIEDGLKTIKGSNIRYRHLPTGGRNTGTASSITETIKNKPSYWIGGVRRWDCAGLVGAALQYVYGYKNFLTIMKNEGMTQKGTQSIFDHLKAKGTMVWASSYCTTKKQLLRELNKAYNNDTLQPGDIFVTRRKPWGQPETTHTGIIMPDNKAGDHLILNIHGTDNVSRIDKDDTLAKFAAGAFNSNGAKGFCQITVFRGCAEEPDKGKITLTKKARGNSGQPTVVQGQGIKGAVYGIYTTLAGAKSDNADKRVTKKTTDSDGSFTAKLAQGTYYVKELSVPWPYLVNNEVVKYVVKAEKTTTDTQYDNSVPPIKIHKKVRPAIGDSVTKEIGSYGTVETKVELPRNNIYTTTTTFTAVKDVAKLIAKSASPNVSAPNVTTFANIKAGQSVTFTQTFTGGWETDKSSAPVCSVGIDGAETLMYFSLPAKSVAGTIYNIYSDAACTGLVGSFSLDSFGIGEFGKAQGEFLASNTIYYVRENKAVAPYSTSDTVYMVKTGTNAEVMASVYEYPNILYINKKSANPSYTNLFSGYTIKGAKYGIFATQADAATHSEAKALRVLVCDGSGKAVNMDLAEGTYYITELPSSVTRPYPLPSIEQAFSDAGLSMSSVTTSVSGQPACKWLVDETITPVTLRNGQVATITSKEQVPVRIKVDKQSTSPQLNGYKAFSLKGAVFGVYASEAAANAAKVVSYGSGEALDRTGAISFIYCNVNGDGGLSRELPLADYWVKEIRTPANYRDNGASHWAPGGLATSVKKISISDFTSSTRYADGVLVNTSIARVNEPIMKLSVKKVTKDLDNVVAEKLFKGMFSLTGAKFAVYANKTDAAADRNRVAMFVNGTPTDTLAVKDGAKTDVGVVPAKSSYWMREVTSPTSKTGLPSAYITDPTPFEVVIPEGQESATIEKEFDNSLKSIELSISKSAYDYDEKGRKLHVQENSAYSPESLEGALFAVFDDPNLADSCPTTDDVTDMSITQKAKSKGALYVAKTGTGGKADAIKGVPWKPGGYYVREIKAPTSGCYKLNEQVYHIGYDNASQGKMAKETFDITSSAIKCGLDIADAPNYYYILLRKTNADESKIDDQANYPLEGVHFAVYATKAEAEAATRADLGNPLYSVYTQKRAIRDEDGNITGYTYDAVTGVTGPGTFWAREFASPRNNMNSFQENTAAIPVTASIGGIPDYEKTLITMGKDGKTAKELS